MGSAGVSCWSVGASLPSGDGAGLSGRSTAAATTARPNEITTDAVTSAASPLLTPTWVRTSRPTAEVVSPPAIRDRGLVRCAIGAASCEPMMNPPRGGQRPEPRLQR